VSVGAGEVTAGAELADGELADGELADGELAGVGAADFVAGTTGQVGAEALVSGCADAAGLGVTGLAA
jgi:hypothetical protein